MRIPEKNKPVAERALPEMKDLYFSFFRRRKDLSITSATAWCFFHCLRRDGSVQGTVSLEDMFRSEVANCCVFRRGKSFSGYLCAAESSLICGSDFKSHVGFRSKRSLYVAKEKLTKSSGSGTSGEPYLIQTLDNLAWLQDPANKQAWGSYYEQTVNIDASPTSGWNSGAGFSPVGNSSTPFSGTYDGQGHSINGLYISLGGSSQSVGMFGFAAGATIKNLGLINETVKGNSQVGGLVGTNIIGRSPS